MDKAKHVRKDIILPLYKISSKEPVNSSKLKYLLQICSKIFETLI